MKRNGLNSLMIYTELFRLKIEIDLLFIIIVQVPLVLNIYYEIFIFRFYANKEVSEETL